MVWINVDDFPEFLMEKIVRPLQIVRHENLQVQKLLKQESFDILWSNWHVVM